MRAARFCESLQPKAEAQAKMTAPRWKFWGWGYEGSGLTADETRRLLQFYAERFGIDDAAPQSAPTVDDVALRSVAARAPAPGRPSVLDRAIPAPGAHLRQIVSGRRARVRAGVRPRAGCGREAAVGG